MIVCILGMHRSGTSVAARILNVLGVDLGPDEHLIAPRFDNPKGFWEHKQIVELNKELIGGPGRRIQLSPDFRPKYMEAPNLDKMRRRARSIIESDFQGAEIWGWKDPRTCLTLPFWQSILPEMHYVVCVRHPVHSAQSLQARDGISLLEGVHSWLVHVISGLEGTTGQPRLIISFEEIMQNASGVLRRLAEFIGRPDRASDPDVQRSVSEFIDPNAYHHQRGVGPRAEKALSPGVLSQIDKAYRMLTQHDHSDAVEVLADALVLVREQVTRQRAVAAAAWRDQRLSIIGDLDRFATADSSVILVGRNELGCGGSLESKLLPFLERDGQYWGPPADDATAIRELERMRVGGAGFIVFAWPAFWWLNHYAGFHDYLRARFPLILRNERLVAFDLRDL